MTLGARALVGVLGATLVIACYLAVGLPLADAPQLIGLAVGGAVLAGLAGAGVLRLTHSGPFWLQVSVVALTSVVALAVGTSGAAAVMFLSAHDFSAFSVILSAAGVVGVLTALTLAMRVGDASRSLGEAARGIAEGEVPAGPARVATRELEQLHAQLRDTARRLDAARSREQAADAARRELVSWVSHDLRTPLAGIRAVTEALEDRVVTDPETVQRYYVTLRREADHLTALVDGLFELSRLHAGQLPMERERVDLGDLVSDTLATAGPTAEAKKVQLKGRVRGAAPQAHVSPHELGRVLANLVGNAVRETPEGASVCVETSVEGASAVLSVTDQCGGIAADDLPRVFDAGFRGSASRTPRTDAGAGLGLAIAQGIVHAHGGEITVHNVERGCRFSVRVPLDPPEESDA